MTDLKWPNRSEMEASAAL